MPMEELFWYGNKLFDTSSRTRFTVMNKLCKDGYAEQKEFNNMTCFFITFDGLVFLEKKGYRGQLRKEKQRKRLNDVLAITIAVSGSIASYYYLLEIVNYEKNHHKQIHLNQKVQLKQEQQNTKKVLQTNKVQ